MAYPDGIKPWTISEFSNLHDNFTQKLDRDQSYDLFINTDSFNGLKDYEKYNKCTANLKWVIGDAIAKNINIRAMGSGWSLSKVAVSDDAIINTKRLRLKFRLKHEDFDPKFLAQGHEPSKFMFLQCGNTVISINKLLESGTNPPKSLCVSGGSNGQTVVGAFSTGTHGAALYYGSVCDMVLGMHIVTGPDREVYIEKSSRRVTSPLFQNKISTSVILDDDLFNAALISFGSFGIIHGVLVEIEDKFLLKQKLGRVPFDGKMDAAVHNGDFSGLSSCLPFPINDPVNKLYHFELAINPHDFEFNNPNKGVYMRTMFRIPVQPYNRILVKEKYSYGDDTLGLVRSVLDLVEKSAGVLNKWLIPEMVNRLFNLAYDRPEEAIGTIGETFNTTKFRGRLFSAAFCVKREDVKRVVEICLDINASIKLAGVMALRFVKGTSATLGFAIFDNSCVLELDGADAAINYDFMKALANEMEANSIPYTLHWGKINRIADRARVEKMYGAERVREWKRQRSRIVAPDVQRVFNNEFMEKCGLDEHVPYEGIA